MVYGAVAKLYKGMTLAGPTAVIVLLLAHHAPITQSLAVTRTLEIMLGVVVAVIVTVFVWPYRVTDHLKLNRIKRLSLLQQQFSQLFVAVTDNKLLTKDWNKNQSKLIELVKGEKSYVALAKRELKTREENKLRVELRIVKSLTRLGETLPCLPSEYWKSKALNNSTQKLLEGLVASVLALSENKGLSQNRIELQKSANKFYKDFKSFRSAYQKSKGSSFSIDEVYQIFTVYQSLQECVDMMEVLSDLSDGS